MEKDQCSKLRAEVSEKTTLVEDLSRTTAELHREARKAKIQGSLESFLTEAKALAKREAESAEAARQQVETLKRAQWDAFERNEAMVRELTAHVTDADTRARAAEEAAAASTGADKQSMQSLIQNISEKRQAETERDIWRGKYEQLQAWLKSASLEHNLPEVPHEQPGMQAKDATVRELAEADEAFVAPVQEAASSMALPEEQPASSTPPTEEKHSSVVDVGEQPEAKRIAPRVVAAKPPQDEENKISELIEVDSSNVVSGEPVPPWKNLSKKRKTLLPLAPPAGGATASVAADAPTGDANDTAAEAQSRHHKHLHHQKLAWKQQEERLQKLRQEGESCQALLSLVEAFEKEWREVHERWSIECVKGPIMSHQALREWTSRVKVKNAEKIDKLEETARTLAAQQGQAQPVLQLGQAQTQQVVPPPPPPPRPGLPASQLSQQQPVQHVRPPNVVAAKIGPRTVPPKAVLPRPQNVVVAKTGFPAVTLRTVPPRQ